MDNKVLKHITTLLLAILLLSFLVDRLLFAVFNAISDEVYTGQSVGKLNHYLEIKDEVNVLIYGNSRVGHHVDPEVLAATSFNMGVDGRKIAYSATLVHLLETTKKQTVLFHIDTDNAFSASYTGKDIQALSVKYNRNAIIKDQMDALHMNNPLQTFFNTMSYNTIILGVLKNYVRPKYDYRDYKGFDPIEVSENQRRIFLNKRNRAVTKTPCRSDFRLNEIYQGTLLRLKEFCKGHNKKLVLFTSPMFSDECKEDNVQLKMELGKMGIDYYDFTHLFQEDPNLDYWKDRIHLSGKGAEIFSEKLRERLREAEVPYF